MTFRPALRPGAVVVRRDPRHLQVGTSPGTVIEDQPGLMRMLRLLDGARDVERLVTLARSEAPSLDVRAVVARLAAQGAVVDASRWGVADPALQSESRRFGRATLSRRSSFRVALNADRGSHVLALDAERLMRASGVEVTPSVDADLVVVLTTGEPSRQVFEQLTHQGLDHLSVVTDEDRVRIGPLVRPGSSPCVVCLDLHRCDDEPEWAAILTQLGRAGAPTPPAVAATTRAAAATELAVEVVALCDDTPAVTVGGLIEVGPSPRARTVRSIPFHHRCGCSLLTSR